MIRKFVNRKEELEFLEREFKDTGLKVIILYGRRRVGKTELINQFCKDKPHIYFLADKRGTQINAREFAAHLARYFNDITPEVRNFDDAFLYIQKRTGDRKLIVAIDEFAYLVEKDDSIPSVFQKIIEKRILGKGNPLYDEVEFILRAELREPSVYMSVVEAIANGVTKVTEIANRCYMNAKDIQKYSGSDSFIRIGVMWREEKWIGHSQKSGRNSIPMWAGYLNRSAGNLW